MKNHTQGSLPYSYSQVCQQLNGKRTAIKGNGQGVNFFEYEQATYMSRNVGS